MSAQVNLLPPELAEQKKARRTTQLTMVGVAAWLAVLGGLYVVKDGHVDDAEAARDAAQTEVTGLEAQVAELDEYRQIAAELDARQALLASAMGDEVSWARVLNDLSLAFPADASMTTLTAGLTPVEEAEPGAIKPDPSLGDIAFTGYSVEHLAPGVEGLLTEFDTALGFVNTYLNTAARTERGDTEVTDFNGNVQLDDHARTGRYADGLPTEVTQ